VRRRFVAAAGTTGDESEVDIAKLDVPAVPDRPHLERDETSAATRST
jgi:hypothetical protein